MVRELNLKFKLAIQQKGGVGIRSLRRIFKQMDYNGNNKLDSSEFEQALAAFGIFPAADALAIAELTLRAVRLLAPNPSPDQSRTIQF